MRFNLGQDARIKPAGEVLPHMSAYYEQPLRKLLGSLSPTIGWLSEKGTVEVTTVPPEHVDAIKQLERIGIVHKRNNRMYELQKVRLKKLMDQMGMDTLQTVAAKTGVAVDGPLTVITETLN